MERRLRQIINEILMLKKKKNRIYSNIFLNINNAYYYIMNHFQIFLP